MKVVHLITGEVFWDENKGDKQEVREGEAAFDARREIDRMALATLMFERLEKGQSPVWKEVERGDAVEGGRGQVRPDICGWDDRTRLALKQYMERHLSHIHEDLKRIALSCNDDLTVCGLYELPVGSRWLRRADVTLIGDAAHVCTPCAGEGVNVAMKDAHVFSQEMVKGEKSLDDGIEDYEEEMIRRSTKAAIKTAGGKQGHTAHT